MWLRSEFRASVWIKAGKRPTIMHIISEVPPKAGARLGSADVYSA